MNLGLKINKMTRNNYMFSGLFFNAKQGNKVTQHEAISFNRFSLRNSSNYLSQKNKKRLIVCLGQFPRPRTARYY